MDLSALHDLQAALGTVVDGPDRRAGLGAAARTCILERYDVYDRVEEFHALYQELIE